MGDAVRSFSFKMWIVGINNIIIQTIYPSLHISRYELSNGTFVATTGALKEINAGDDQSKVAISVGVFNYVGSDGQTYWVKWTVDENGFSPEIGRTPPKELQKVVDETRSDNNLIEP